ncbi:MAG: terminase [Firmicutes bacterium]|nr:terminase [Bacillota bacterium]
MNGVNKSGEEKKRREFLSAYAEYGNVTQAAQKAGIDRASHHKWLREIDGYREAFSEAIEEAADRLEREAWTRAVIGVDRIIYYRGEPCGVVRDYSDTLLMFLLKAARPELYKERAGKEAPGADGRLMILMENGLDPEVYGDGGANESGR